MNDKEPGHIVFETGTDLPPLWLRNKRGYLCRQVGHLTLQVFPTPPATPAAKWGQHWQFKIRADGEKPYTSKVTFATEQEAVRQAILYVLAGLAPKGDEDDEQDYPDE
jgi:hypothetical protein